MSGIKILLVDDEEDFVSTLAERLELRNLTSQAALDGEAAMKAIDCNVPDILVLDLNMPGLEGMEVLRRVRGRFPHVQIIIQTANSDDLDEAEARELGVFDYLKKPVDIECLIERIRSAYKDRHGQF